MAVGIRATAQVLNGATATTTITVSKPTGTTAGDMLIAYIGTTSQTTDLVAPDGWIRIGGLQKAGTQTQLGVYYRIATATEPTSWSWLTTSAKNFGWIGAYTGADLSAVPRVVGGNSNASSTAWPMPAIVPSSGGWIISGICGRIGSGTGVANTWTITGGDTQRYTGGCSNNSGSVDICPAVYDTNTPLKPHSVHHDFTSSLTVGQAAYIVVDLKPASVPAGYALLGGGMGITGMRGLQLDRSSPPVARSLSGTTVTTDSFLPPANSLLVAIATCDTATGNTTATIGMSDTETLSWTQYAERSKHDDGGSSNDGHISVHYAVVGATPAAMTVTATATNAADDGMGLTVLVFTGADTADPLRSTEASNGGSIAQDLTTSVDNSWCWLGVVDRHNDMEGGGTATGSTALTSSVTTAAIDISSVTDSWTVYCFVALGANQSAVTMPGWTLVLEGDESTTSHYALFRRLKQSGDASFSASWTTATKGVLAWVAYSGIDIETPDERATFYAHTSGTDVVAGPDTPNLENRWAVTFSYMRSTTEANKNITWTPDAALTERLDANNSASTFNPWVGTEIADSAAVVAQSSASYTAVSNQSETHGGVILLYLIPSGRHSTSAGELVRHDIVAPGTLVHYVGGEVAVTPTATTVVTQHANGFSSIGAGEIAFEVRPAA